MRNVSTLLEQNGKLAAAEKRPSARARLLWALPALALGAVAFLLVTERSRGPAQPGPQLEVVEIAMDYELLLHLDDLQKLELMKRLGDPEKWPAKTRRPGKT